MCFLRMQQPQKFSSRGRWAAMFGGMALSFVVADMAVQGNLSATCLREV